MTVDPSLPTTRLCSSCHGELAPGSLFCEVCGASASAPVSSGSSGSAGPASSTASAADGRMLLLGGTPRTQPPAAEVTQVIEVETERCACGGEFADGYCGVCGAPRPDPRDHEEIECGPHLAGVCDVGLRHSHNQDAMAISDRQIALVVCDGVSSAPRSEEASRAAADAAVAVLAGATSTGVGVPSALLPAMAARLDAAADAAADAVARVTGDPANTPEGLHPACTFVAAVVEGDHVVVGSVGDSRAYWVPDSGPAQRLTVDDSWAEEQVAHGVPRAEAETGPHAHTITRWLGHETPDHRPATTTLRVDRPGWLLVCSDGLWNYASDPDALARVVHDVAVHARATDSPQPTNAAQSTNAAALDSARSRLDIDALTLARGLVTWANAQGGRDNITVTLARLGQGAPDRPDEQSAEADGYGEENPLDGQESVRHG